MGKHEFISCKSCGFTTTKETLERLCSNCFACTGCVRFNCPNCGNEIVEKPVAGFRMKKKERPD